MGTASFEMLSKLEVVRRFLGAFRAATGARIRLEIADRGMRIEKPAKSAMLRVPILIGGEPVAILRSDLIAVAAVHDRRPRKQKSPEPVGGHRPPLQLSRSQWQGCQRLLRLFTQLLSESAARNFTANGKHDPPWLVRAKEFIQAHATESVTQKEVARHVRYSEDHFRKRFRDVARMPFGEHLARVRVEKSKELIADPHRRLSDIAFAAGFQSIPSFNRVFKQYTGLSPTQYRMSLRFSSSSSSSSSSSKHPR